MKFGKWLKITLLVFLGLAATTFLLALLAFWQLVAPKAALVVDNASAHSVEVVRIAYAGKTIAANVTLEAGSHTEVLCVFAYPRTDITLDVKIGQAPEVSTHRFPVRQGVVEQCYREISVSPDAVTVSTCSYFEGINPYDCVTPWD